MTDTATTPLRCPITAACSVICEHPGQVAAHLVTIHTMPAFQALEMAKAMTAPSIVAVARPVASIAVGTDRDSRERTSRRATAAARARTRPARTRHPAAPVRATRRMYPTLRLLVALEQAPARLATLARAIDVKVNHTWMVLHRLRTDGLIVSEGYFYRITAAGHAELGLVRRIVGEQEKGGHSG